MQYLLLIYGEESSRAGASDEANQQMMAEYGAYTNALIKSGQMKGGEAVQPSATATTVRVRNGERLITDGPFAETKEQLLGFYVVDCASLEEAIEIARPLFVDGGALEIRPVLYFNSGSGVR